MEATTLLPLLEENGYITQDQSAEIQDELYRTGKPIEEILVNYQIFKNEKELAEKIAPLVGAEYIDLDTINFTPAILSSIPPQTARFHEAVPVSVEGNTITIALSDPLNIQARDDLGFVTNKTIQIAFAPPSEIRKKSKNTMALTSAFPTTSLPTWQKKPIRSKASKTRPTPHPSSNSSTPSLPRPSKLAPPTSTSNLSRPNSKSATAWTAPFTKCRPHQNPWPPPSPPASKSCPAST
jgi:hypothetical protein